MNDTLFIGLIGFLVGALGAVLGAFITIKFVKPSNRVMGLVMGVTSGVILATITFDLLPESYALGGLWVEVGGVVLGMMMMFFIENFMQEDDLNSFRNDNKSHMTRAGLLLSIGVALHHLPEGLAIGSSFAVNPSFGLTITLVIAIHSLPEGMAVAIPLKIGGVSNAKIFLLSIISGIPTGIGAILGAILGNVSTDMVALSLAFAGGCMLYITCGELIPNSKSLYNGRLSTFGICLGFLLGMVTSGVI